MPTNSSAPHYFETRIGIWVDHLKAAKIPLLIVVFGVVLTFRVDQISELFFLLAKTAPFYQRISAMVMAFMLGIAVWYTTRTIYRFDFPGLPALSSPRGALIRAWLPRVLGALVPLFMMGGYLIAMFQPSIRNRDLALSYLLPIVFFAEALVLFFFLTKRRAIQRRFSSKTAARPEDEPRIERWSQLERPAKLFYVVIMTTNVLALFMAAKLPGRLVSMGTLSFILLSATFLTTSGTYLSIQAYRWRFPMLTTLFLAAVLWQSLDLNDNHHVRLFHGMGSDGSPDAGRLQAHRVVPGAMQKSFRQYALDWKKTRPADSPIYLVSAEGGGIRAAAWAALVLTQLEMTSNGQFSQSMLAGSGVSGGSVGLALFDSMVRAHADGTTIDDPIALRRFLEADFLAPSVEAMFLTDFTQRFVPWPMFIDRGQRLEMRWERAWNRAANCETNPGDDPLPSCAKFSQPWTALWAGPLKADMNIPPLFLNSVVVQTGQRFVQHPFTSISGVDEQTDFDLLHGAMSSVGRLPASVPLSTVAHDSARFTYVSPVGTLLPPPNSNLPKLQLADGGYFENSGATTLLELAQLLAQDEPSCAHADGGLAAPSCRIRFIHISNDTMVESFLGDDRCVDDEPGESTAKSKVYGESTAPMLALLNTREARGQYARLAMARAASGSTTAKGAAAHVYHFRLCRGDHSLPLGWTLSDEAMFEMRNQLCNKSSTPESKENSLFNSRQSSEIATGQRVDESRTGLCDDRRWRIGGRKEQ